MGYGNASTKGVTMMVRSHMHRVYAQTLDEWRFLGIKPSQMVRKFPQPTLPGVLLPLPFFYDPGLSLHL